MRTETLILDITNALRNQRLARQRHERMRAVHRVLCQAIGLGIGSVAFLAMLLAFISDYSGQTLLALFTLA